MTAPASFNMGQDVIMRRMGPIWGEGDIPARLTGSVTSPLLPRHVSDRLAVVAPPLWFLLLVLCELRLSYKPRAFARSHPSAVRLRIRSRSNSARRERSA
jgi:hypothetical protein